MDEHQLQNKIQELENRVSELSAQLQRKTKEMEDFTYTVSHDLKAPLRGIDGYARILLAEKSDGLDEDSLRFLNIIVESAQKLHQLIDDLLTYSRLERRTLDYTTFEIQSVMDILLLEREQRIRADQGRLSIDIKFKTMTSESSILKQVLGSYLDNALKFKKPGCPPEINVGGEETKKAYRIWVKDKGIGFDMKYHDRIFEVFQRLHTDSEFPGTGIGLALAKKAAQRIQALVWAQSSLGQGAQFYIEIAKAIKPKNKVEEK